MKILPASLILLGLLVLLSACDSTGGGKSGRIRVMTRNVSIGGDIDRVLVAKGEEVPVAVLFTWQEIVANDFSVRAAALADEIRQVNPHVIGLQEITTLLVQNPGDKAFGGNEPATDVAYDYLEILQDALEDRGLDYEVAGMVADTDAEMPMVVNVDPLAFWDVRMNDYDVVLVRSDVDVANVFTASYEARVIVDFGSETLAILRGYVAFDAMVGDHGFRFISTHPEPVSEPALQDLQLAQIDELLTALGDGTTILVGDMNTGPGEPSYEALTDAGLVDAWTEVHGADPGLTCCYNPNLLPGRPLSTRYDLVLYRNGSMTGLIPEKVVITGTETIPDAGIYPSDHAGTAVTFRVD